MPGTRYRRGELYAADMAHYARVLSEQNTNTQEMDRVKLALWRALHEDISEKQLNYMLLYYGEGLKMSEIGERQTGGVPAPPVPALRRQALSGGRQAR